MASASPMVRRFGLIHATALNMTNMIGIGPFIMIPLLMSALGGPQAMLGWLVALIIVMCDGMVWSELGAALPGSGGSFGYLRRGYGTEQVGRLMGFLFFWQFVLSGPLEIASGYIGFSQYLGYIWKGITARQTMLDVTIVGLANLRSEEHTSELQSHSDLVCRLLLVKKDERAWGGVAEGSVFAFSSQPGQYRADAPGHPHPDASLIRGPVA